MYCKQVLRVNPKCTAVGCSRRLTNYVVLIPILCHREGLTTALDGGNGYKVGKAIGLADPLPWYWKGIISPDQLMGTLVASAVPLALARIVPVWSVKKYRCPVVPGCTGAAAMV